MQGGGAGSGANPGEAMARALERARGLLELGRPQAALTEVQRALSAAGAHGPGTSGGPPAEALQLIGLCLIRLGDPAAARQALRSAVVSDPNDAHGHYLLGYAYSESREDGDASAGAELAAEVAADPALALSCYREALRLSPEQPVYLRALAEALAARKQFAEALALANKAVSLAPDRASNHITLGYVASSSGDRELARRAYQQALVLEPNSALAWNNLGCVDLAQGRVLHARERFREALRLDPAGSVAQDNYRLVSPQKRPLEIFHDFAAFERQLVIEVWQTVLFSSTPAIPPPARVGPPLSPLQFFKNYLSPSPGKTITRRLQDDPRLHAAALLWATGWRPLGAVWWRAPSILMYLGVSVSLLRAGPVGAAVALSSGAAAALLSRPAIRRRHDLYKDQLFRLRERWDRHYADWLAGTTARHQRDTAMGHLLDEFCRFVEAQRESLPPGGEPTGYDDPGPP